MEIRLKYPLVKLDEDVYNAIAKLVGDAGVSDLVNELLREHFKLVAGQSSPKEPE
jgi:hypothetical protein